MRNQSLKISRRLAKLERSLGTTSQPKEMTLCQRVQLEVQQELSPDELRLYRSAEAARRERRFHSLEESDVMEKVKRLRDLAAQRYGSRYYIRLLHKQIMSQPKSKRSATERVDIAEALVWGRNNLFHVIKLREVQQASQSSSSVSLMQSGPSSGSTN